ncbi:hypothetical protein O6H91_19G049000 [Diphasiastrum complanatum]|uniref:Uncharacterized protein n=1 Tax=Diphasiastrum complanatum TaxID=34168 RepID=A0ACC2AV07_DIPCM|nr:hypothetical protein O6H91_19G049000 [Diphasiastrum complanatum]
MEVLQAQLASDLNSNCRLVLMNEVLKSGWMIECTGKLSSEISDTADAHTVDKVDNSSEYEPSYFQNPDERHGASSITLRRKNAEADSVPTDSTCSGKQQCIAGIFGTESRSLQSFEKKKAAEVISAVAPRGPYQRPARIIKPPDWLPDGWTAEIRTREMGNTAGTKDKYYVDPTTGRRFRSKNEVMEYVETGNLSRWKRRAKPAELNCSSVTASVAQIACPSHETRSTSAINSFLSYRIPPKQVTAASQNWSIPPFAWGPLQGTNNYVNVDSYLHKADNPEKIYSASSCQYTNQQNVRNSGYERSHIPWLPINGNFVSQVMFRPRPVEIIDLEAIPDTTLSIATRPISEYPTRLIPPEFFMPFAGPKGKEAKEFSPQLRGSNKDMQWISKHKQLHLGVHNIIREGNANNMVETCQVSKLSVSYGSNSSHGDPLVVTSTSASYVTDTLHANVAGESSGGCKETASFDTNRSSSVPQLSAFPVSGSPLDAGTPLPWHDPMHLPTSTKSWALQHSVSRLHEKDKTCKQAQLHNGSQLFEKDTFTRNFVRRKPSSTPLEFKKLQNSERHQDKKQLELLGKKLCHQGIALMSRELPPK